MNEDEDYGPIVKRIVEQAAQILWDGLVKVKSEEGLQGFLEAHRDVHHYFLSKADTYVLEELPDLQSKESGRFQGYVISAALSKSLSDMAQKALDDLKQ